uniref:Protein FAR1-RELATED SEQUENCE n=1 Tax=Heterorhabditis bacteriophora TaxID=37862 RepID=A0A1I7WMA2_HETBA
MNHKGYLQSWAHELEHFESLSSFAVNSNNCDVVFEKPTVIMKLDASVNMYHHFCDFVNLYASQHINGTFIQDIEIVWWDTFYSIYRGQYKYNSFCSRKAKLQAVIYFY